VTKPLETPPLVIRAQTSDVAGPRWGRRLRRLAILVLLLLAAVGAAGWVLTPSGSDVQSRVAGRAAALQVSQLAAGQVPAPVAAAVVASEEERVFAPSGADPLALAGQLAYDVRYGCECRIDHAMTRELVDALYVQAQPARPWTSAEAALLTFRVEQTVDERVVLADELTLAPFGDRLVGAPSASQALFGRPLDRLDLAQAALLVAIRRAGPAADPREHPDAARARRGQVLRAMVADGYVTPGAAAAAQAEPLLPAAASDAHPRPAAQSSSATSSSAAPAPAATAPAATPVPARAGTRP
jgi:membrane peptidoglycan carboxypeptidase